jgi:MerR family mercuric resistance operon transcriptional regulator
MTQLTSGRLALRGGVNVETLRYYERNGLLEPPPRSAAGYRHYPIDAVRRLRFIKRAQGLGFTLAEIKELLALQARPDATCAEVRSLAKAKIEDVDRRLRDLKALRASLVEVARACAGVGPSAGCSILQTLSDKEAQ